MFLDMFQCLLVYSLWDNSILKTRNLKTSTEEKAAPRLLALDAGAQGSREEGLSDNASASTKLAQAAVCLDCTPRAPQI